VRTRVLMVEDDKDLCEELREILLEESFEVDFANSGDRGLKMATEGTYDLVMVDLRLPGMSGLELLRELSERDLASPVLVVTGQPMSDDLRDAERSEMKREVAKLADGIITKPFDVPHLLAAIRALLP
jgi:DNA-binding response OmpR family regulator